MMEASVVPFEYAGWPSRDQNTETLLRIINDTPRMPAEVYAVPAVRALIEIKWRTYARRMVVREFLLYISLVRG